jgi:serine phosphatase RsbU (regulator of sigma subunit)
MTADPYVIGPAAGWERALGQMESLKVRHLPVIEGGRVVGIVSAGMLMARRAEFLNRAIETATAELRRAYDTLLAKDADLAANLRTASRLQRKVMLPNAPPDWPDLRWAVHYAPLDQLGGDYYDFATPDEQRLGVLVADASGHGIAAALVAIMARFAFIEEADFNDNPGDVLGAMNDRLQELAEERFVTAFYGVYDRQTGALRYASAGHPPPLHYEAATGAVRPLSARGFMLGIMPEERYTERQVAVRPGDRICFYTDGLIEARNEIGEQFGVDRLTGCLTNHGGLPADELKQHILGCQRAFSGTEKLNDDLTLAVMEVVAPDQPPTPAR